jgi:hypothetical protein
MEDYTHWYTVRGVLTKIRLHIHRHTDKSVVGKGLVMKDYLAKRVVKLTVMLAATGAFMLVFTPSVQAQQRNPIDVFNAERARQRAEAEQQRALEHIREGGMKPAVTDPRQKLMLMAQIKEDFHRIQVVNNEMLRTAFKERAPDYESLSEKAADIKRRASRLKTTIKLPPPREDRKQKPEIVGVEGLKASLLELRKLIGSFVNNPYFQKKPGVIDVQLTDKASSDLRDIIELCEDIKKNARRLDKNSK